MRETNKITSMKRLVVQFFSNQDITKTNGTIPIKWVTMCFSFKIHSLLESVGRSAL